MRSRRDRVGLDCCENEGGFFFPSSSTEYLWLPALADGQTAPAFVISSGVLINADVEPDADRDGFGDETQDRCPADASAQGLPCPVKNTTRQSCRGTAATITGTTGPDALRGTSGRDVIQALGGDDTVTGLGGKDLVCGGVGDDTLRGKAGRDTLIGGADSDLLRGGGGVDKLIGGSPGSAGASASSRDRCPDPGPDRLTGCSPS
jgi:hypothetical protein